MQLIEEKKLLNLLQDISYAVAKADGVGEAYREVLTHICRFMGWPLAHVYIWSEAEDALVSSHIWFMADASTITPFRELSEATLFRRGEGTLGRVWESGEAVFVLDVRKSTIFVRQMPVEEGGIRAYFAFPVIMDGKVAAVLEFFSPDSGAPDQDVTSIIAHVSSLLGLAKRRQQTIQSLQASETKLAEAQRIAHVGHWEWDVVTDVVTWSPELYRIFGQSPENFEANYEAFLRLIHPDDLGYVTRSIENAYRDGRAFNYFHRIVRPDGSVRVLHARGHPQFDKNDRVVRLYGTALDITEQKETELKLAQTVRRLSALMEIGQAISASLELNEIYEQVLTLLRPLIGAEALILFLYKEEMLEIVAVDQENVGELQGLRIPKDSGIAGAVWQSEEALYLKGDACRQRLSPRLREITGYEPGVMLAVPVRWRNRAVGVIEATHRDENAFAEDDLQLMQSAATWTAIAIGNARQYEQLQRRLKESNAILEISTALTQTLDLDQLLRLIAERAKEAISRADWSTIHLLQKNANQLRLAASSGLGINPSEYIIDLGQGIAGRVMRDGEVINVGDVQTDPRRLSVDRSTQARALLVAPVESGLNRIGTISVQSSTPIPFTEGDQRLLKILGVQAGMAIENARLYARQQQATKRAERQRERMRHLARRVVEAQEKERARVARELHDESGQSLTSLKISLDLIQSMLPDEMGEVKESLREILALTDQTMSNLRLLSHNLRPPGLDAYGLDAALAGLCLDFETHTATDVSYSGIDDLELEPLRALSLYRFAQEALTNAAKHAEADKIRVTLKRNDDMILLTVEDNGRGFTPPNFDETIPARGAGLVGMIERLEMVNGRLSIRSGPGRGSCLTATVPFKGENE
ncbi:MAG: GAF domain-containing protein [Candidatus Promineifilaceae bacterium]|nr:GAF domain-containing protein [Candidatus Promineifilaceae bacterium]